jgi:type VI protein secretion system component Hcp
MAEEAFDAFMILVGEDGVISGETTDRDMSATKAVVGGATYTGAAIEITNFSLSGRFSDTHGEPSDTKPTPRLLDKLELSVTKNLDSSSANLMSAYCQHLQTTLTVANLKPFKQLQIIVRKAGDVAGFKVAGAKRGQYLSLVFEEVYLAAYTCGGTHQSNQDMPTESLTFRFKTVSMSYWPQQTRGGVSLSKMIPMNWDFFGSFSA